MIDLNKKLKEYTSSDIYPFHMPGHKRRTDFAGWLNAYDITEVPGFDDLHHPEDLLKDLMDEAAALYGTKHTFYLVNGSTCGILASISAACAHDKKIILARNSHKSAYHALELMGLDATYVYPEWTDIGIQGSISPAEVKKALEENPDVKAVYITSPT
ncbi:MAG: ornithine decarboxylase, partial [Lachnospiraceae bacterium]|nr:ornithine decarboxylase [Lachnospiraceae bacterium]